MGATVNPVEMATEVTVRCGHRRPDGTRCKRIWFTIWVRPNDDPLVLNKGGEWKRSPKRREGVWFEGLWTDADGFIHERARWRVICSKPCRSEYMVTKETLLARATMSSVDGERTLYLADLATG